MKPATPTARRTPVRIVLALLLAATFAALTIAPAQAVAYRYWGFYQLTDGKWSFAQKGSDQVTPADGSVDGWRFAINEASASRLPRAVADFGQICAQTPAQQGKKRVGLVIDFGRAADNADPAKGAGAPTPKAVCAVVAADANSTEVLKAASDLRTEKGLICAVDGYPAAGCGAEIKDNDLPAAAKAPDKAITLTLPDSTGASAAPGSSSPSASGSATSSAPAPPAAGGSVTTTTSDTATTAADASRSATAASSGSSVGTTIAYVVAALALIALVVFLVLRARASRKSDV